MRRDIVITGGRDFDDEIMMSDVLNFIRPKLIYHGDCTGADTLAQKWATENNVKTKRYPVTPKEWATLGKKAGPLRNDKMLSDAGFDAMVIAFPGGRGTASCIKLAIAKNMMVMRVEDLE